MASTGGGAARSGKKRNPDVADPEEASQAELVGAVGTNDAIDRKLDLLVTTIAALADSANKLINAGVKDEKVAEPSKKLSVDRSGILDYRSCPNQGRSHMTSLIRFHFQRRA